MNLLGNDKEKNIEEALPAEVLPDELKEETASAVKEASQFVMDIEGLDLTPEEEPAQDLRGATRTLPGQEEIREAIETVAVPEEKPAADDAGAQAPEEAPAAEPAAKPQPEPVKSVEKKEEKLSSVSYASVAQAMVNVKKEPTGRFDRDAVDDETLLAELYALIGDSSSKKTAAPAPSESAAPIQTRPAPRPAVRITPETLQDAPEEFVEVEEDTAGIPGWMKGVFILLISLLLSAMTFYAVASDVIGKIF